MTTSWIDHYAGEGGDMFALIMREQACDFGEAIRWAREFCGMRDAAGEGNRTLVFSLEGFRRLKPFNSCLDKGPLTSVIDPKSVFVAVQTSRPCIASPYSPIRSLSVADERREAKHAPRGASS
jgi:hypothetical protein